MKSNLDWGTIAKYGLILLTITVVCTLLLALTNQVTSPVIEERNIEANESAQKTYFRKPINSRRSKISIK